MGDGVGGCPSGSSSRRGGPVGHRRWRGWPTLARTRRPAGAARCTSAACRTGCPRRGYARSPSGVPPGSVLAARGWRSGRPGHARSGPGGRAGSRSRRPGARLAGRAAARPPPGRPGWPPAARRLCWLAGAGRAARGMPPASTATEGCSPCLRRSTGLGPAVWPPQGALVVQPSTASCSSSKPNSWSSAASTSKRSRSATPVLIHSSRRRPRVVAEQVWSAMRR
jgi:hypothetical protein